MSYPRACNSCGQDSAFARRVRCSRCKDQVHTGCRDIARVCYQCRYRQAKDNGIAIGMLNPSSAGEEPFERNQPDTVAQGLKLPPLADMRHPEGASANALRIMTDALYLGWHVESWEGSGWDRIMLRKHGRGYLRLRLSATGRVLNATTQRLYLTANTTRVLAYLENK